MEVEQETQVAEVAEEEAEVQEGILLRCRVRGGRRDARPRSCCWIGSRCPGATRGGGC